ncbi:thioredoxin family protein [Flavivirga spongiicola]|uniref:Thioredoxin family protein n=1 Tax=Flavivirga spongiicola TaxID=421621 RepID=A0ABU7Y119_9FLAO|nr:thioredoxin family protein [Flavivirga sp. MEBiC05379]MDO5980956.1 thioredoxin family protein [Flavivirga sp. MEBiC05379]
MRKILLGIACLVGLSTMAQNREIEFKVRPWKTQLAAAKKENKLIFFDAYTTWCGPCKVMARDVFTRDKIADLFNDKFVNVKYDMEKGEGIALKDKYEVSAYPTYLFINGDGEVVHKIVGSMTANEFINEANKALNPESTMYGLAKNFEASGHSEASAIAYLDAIKKAYESEKMSVVSKIYFDALEKSTLLDEHNWKLALKYLNNPSSKAFAYLYNNMSKLKKTYKVSEVNNYFQQVFVSSVSRIKRSYNKKSGVKEAKENSKAIRKLLKEGNDYSKVLLAKLDLIEFSAKNQWDKFGVKLDAMCNDVEFSNKSYVLIEAANDIATANQEKQYENALRCADLIEKNTPGLFTQIQLAELRKRVLIRQGKKAEAEAMSQKEKKLRKEAMDKRAMSPPMYRD